MLKVKHFLLFEFLCALSLSCSHQVETKIGKDTKMPIFTRDNRQLTYKQFIPSRRNNNCQMTAHDLRALKLKQKSVVPAASKADLSVRFAVLGEAGVGRRSLVNSYLSPVIIASERPTFSFYPEVQTFARKLTMHKDVLVKLEAYLPEFTKTWVNSKVDIENTVGAFLLYDITNKATYLEAQSCLARLRTNAHLRNARYVLVLVGTKADLAFEEPLVLETDKRFNRCCYQHNSVSSNARQVGAAEAANWAASNGLLFYETSARSGAGVELAFVSAVDGVLASIETATFVFEPGRSGVRFTGSLQTVSQKGYFGTLCDRALEGVSLAAAERHGQKGHLTPAFADWDSIISIKPIEYLLEIAPRGPGSGLKIITDRVPMTRDMYLEDGEVPVKVLMGPDDNSDEDDDDDISLGCNDGEIAKGKVCCCGLCCFCCPPLGQLANAWSKLVAFFSGKCCGASEAEEKSEAEESMRFLALSKEAKEREVVEVAMVSLYNTNVFDKLARSKRSASPDFSELSSYDDEVFSNNYNNNSFFMPIKNEEERGAIFSGLFTSHSGTYGSLGHGSSGSHGNSHGNSNETGELVPDPFPYFTDALDEYEEREEQKKALKNENGVLKVGGETARTRHLTDNPQYGTGGEPWLVEGAIVPNPEQRDPETGRPFSYALWTEHVPHRSGLNDDRD